MPITDISQVRGATVTIGFDELKAKDQMLFGSEQVGQPYAKLGMVLPSQMIDARANLGPGLDVAVKSTAVSTIDNSNYQSIAFTRPQKVTALQIRSTKATSILVTALDKAGEVLGQTELPASNETQFAGFVFDDPRITLVRIVAKHRNMEDAVSSPTFVSGITFSSLFVDGDSKSVAETTDLGFAGTVGSPGAGGAGGSALASAAGGGFGGGGTGSAGNLGGGRSPGNRNPNLPPQFIVGSPPVDPATGFPTVPSPAPLLAGTALGAGLLLRRRPDAEVVTFTTTS